MKTSSLGLRVILGIPTTKAARRSVAWIDALNSLQLPLGSSMGRLWIEDRPIAEARNLICEQALQSGAQYLVFLSDDVLPPPNMILKMLDKIGREYPVEGGRVAKASMITGVYWTKTYPSEPYLWNEPTGGSFRDWKVGDFIPVNLAGCDALIIDTKILREIPFPWFSTEWVYEEGQQPSSIATEDFYFFTKARRHGFRLFADTAIQCFHEDRETGQLFGLEVGMPQAGGQPEGGEGLLVAELGAGTSLPTYAHGTKVVRFDIRSDEVRPDVQCDLLAIPEWHFGKYDIVHARHVLEHFPRDEAPQLVAHWARLLKPGGQLIIRVPNLGSALEILSRYAAGEKVDAEELLYAWSQVYGSQRDEYDRHYNGFTARTLAGLLRLCPLLDLVEVVEEDDGLNLKGTAVLVREHRYEAIQPWWDDIRAREAHADVVIPNKPGKGPYEAGDLDGCVIEPASVGVSAEAGSSGGGVSAPTPPSFTRCRQAFDRELIARMAVDPALVEV